MEISENIGGYFDKNIDGTKIDKHSWKCLEKFKKIIKQVRIHMLK